MHKKIVVFDLDGTLAQSKGEMDGEMCSLILRLLKRYHVAIISGAKFEQFVKQCLAKFESSEELLEKLILLPTCGASMHRRKNGEWACLYKEELSGDDKKKIFAAFEHAFQTTNYKLPAKLWGEVFEDRGTQVTFSALGQSAPLEAKHFFDPDLKKRQLLIS